MSIWTYYNLPVRFEECKEVVLKWFEKEINDMASAYLQGYKRYGNYTNVWIEEDGEFEFIPWDDKKLLEEIDGCKDIAKQIEISTEYSPLFDEVHWMEPIFDDYGCYFPELNCCYKTLHDAPFRYQNSEFIIKSFEEFESFLNENIEYFTKKGKFLWIDDYFECSISKEKLLENVKEYFDFYPGLIIKST